MANEVGTLELTKQGQVVSVLPTQKTGQFDASIGDLPLQILSMLEDSGRLLDSAEKFQRLVVSFPSYDYVITVGAENVKVSLCERET